LIREYSPSISVQNAIFVSFTSCSEMDLKGKVALITGGARIGQVVAHSLVERGCDLALIYRGSREAAEASAKAAIDAGVRAITVRADATDEDQVAAAVTETERALGRIDILLNMASIYLSTPEPKQADWSNTIDANARSVFLFSTAAAPIMKRTGGARIINFADWLPVSGRPHYKGFVPYYASKAAVIGLTESLALELAPEILVNAIAPGPILEPPGLTPEENSEVIEATPLRRWGGAAEIAKIILFLVDSDFVTGECIRVDGGRHLI
jgi:NAD(P)-dependent dehydrogenase (short-subunit alcohol dehydrogenase family)